MTRHSRTASLSGRHSSGHVPSTTAGARGRPRSVPSRRLRLAAFAAIAIVLGGGAIGLVVSRLQAPVATDATALQVHGSMGGLEPLELTVKAGSAVKLELTSMDTAFHSDGGGWHEFAIDELGIDFKVGPLSSKVFEFTAPRTAGTYTYYCGICCGGKENPTMVGTLTVTA